MHLPSLAGAAACFGAVCLAFAGPCFGAPGVGDADCAMTTTAPVTNKSNATIARSTSPSPEPCAYPYPETQRRALVRRLANALFLPRLFQVFAGRDVFALKQGLHAFEQRAGG